MMASTNEEDPFLQVQQDVLSQITSARALFASYLRIRSLTTTTTTTTTAAAAAAATSSPELASARADLEASLSTLAEDLADLVESVRAAEAEPSRFGLAPAEIKRRARLVQEVGGEVDDMRDELAKQQQQHQQQASTTTTTTSTSRNNKNPDLPDPSSFAIRDGDDSYAEFEQQQQEVMMREQDGQLDDVFRTVGNLRRQADDMGRELEEQREMIVEVDQLADRVGGRLATGMQKLQYIVRRNEDTLSSWCIGLLIFVLIILLVLLLIL